METDRMIKKKIDKDPSLRGKGNNDLQVPQRRT